MDPTAPKIINFVKINPFNNLKIEIV